MTRFYDVLAPILGVMNAIALLVVVILLLSGPTKKFLVVFVYASWELLATVVLTLGDLWVHGTTQIDPTVQNMPARYYARVYWTNDVIVDLLRFLLVTVLIYKVAGSSTFLKRLLPVCC